MKLFSAEFGVKLCQDLIKTDLPFVGLAINLFKLVIFDKNIIKRSLPFEVKH